MDLKKDNFITRHTILITTDSGKELIVEEFDTETECLISLDVKRKEQPNKRFRASRYRRKTK